MKKLFLILLISILTNAADNTQRIQATDPLVLSNGHLSMPKATAVQNGYLDKNDFVAFSTKVANEIDPLSVHLNGDNVPTSDLSMGGFGYDFVQFIGNTSGDHVVDLTTSQLKRVNGSTSIDFQFSQLVSSLGAVTEDYNQSQLKAGGQVVQQWSTGDLYDLAGMQSANTNTRGLQDSSGQRVLGWQDKQLQDGSGILSQDWQTRSLKDSAALDSLLYGDRKLKTSAGVTVQDWSQDSSFDLSGTFSANFDTRSLMDQVGQSVARWQDLELRDHGGNVSVLWGSRQLLDSMGLVSEDYQLRQLKIASGNIVQDWSQGIFYDLSGNFSANSDTRVLMNSSGQSVLRWTDLYTQDAGGQKSLDWGLRQLDDSMAAVSVDYQLRRLKTSTGNIVQDWSLGTFYDLAGMFSANTNTRALMNVAGQSTLRWQDLILQDASGITSHDWGLRRLKDSAGNTTVDYQALQIKTATATVQDWSLGSFYDLTGSFSANTNTRSLMNAGGQSVLRWQDLLLKDSSGVDSVDWGLRKLLGEDGLAVANWSSDGIQILDHAGGDPNIFWQTDGAGTIGKSDGTGRPNQIHVVDTIGIGEFGQGFLALGDQTLGGTCIHSDGSVVSVELKGIDGVFRIVDDGTHVERGDLFIGTIGGGIRIAEGANARMGKTTLAGGTATVSNTSTTMNTRYFLSNCLLSGATLPAALAVTSVNPGTDFVITSSDVTDTSDVCWELKEAI